MQGSLQEVLMGTDYVLFIHGVNVRSEDYAEPLMDLIRSEIPDSSLVMLPVFFGQLNEMREWELRTANVEAPIWPHLWFTHVRSESLFRFVGDAALYLSRAIGGAIADRVRDTIELQITHAQPGDRLHLVAHSLGTVILFDMLFSSRWDNPPDLPGYDSVQFLREALYGIAGPSGDPCVGIQLSSITTMGSPLGLFKLIDVDTTTASSPLASHDITPRLQIMLRYLRARMEGQKLPWRNYLHPGDPIGSPLQVLLPLLLGEEGSFVDVADILVPSNPLEMLAEPFPASLSDLLMGLVGWSDASILDGVNAHRSYWQSHRVAHDIANTILETRQQAALRDILPMLGINWSAWQGVRTLINALYG
jgi:hypothetical protein